MVEQVYNAFLSCDQKITTDTRNIAKNDLFFALKGPNFNGNKFAEKALELGAKYAIIDESEYFVEGKTFLVENVLETLQSLARFHREKINIPVIAITGTNGKTTTKELLGAVLTSQYNILITEKNLNNHIGVPLTILQLTKEHEIAVIEMGASKIGDIKELVEIALPNYGIITNIGKAHLEGFGDVETIKKTKFELYDFIIKNKGARRVSPQFVAKMIPNIAGGHVSMRFGFRGPSQTVISACASSNDAIGIALRLIRYGDADIMLTGGTEASITPLTIAGFANMRALSQNCDNPTEASRPFDANRDGFVLSEGAGMLVIESEEHALKRGATISVSYTHLTLPTKA